MPSVDVVKNLRRGGYRKRMIAAHGESEKAEAPMSEVGPGPAVPQGHRFPSGHVHVEPLGKGGAGQVYLVTNGAGQRVALKVVPLGTSLGDREKRVIDQVRRLDHRHLLRIHDAVTIDNDLYVEMELADGGSVRQAARAQLPAPEQARAWTLQAAQALDYLHGQPNPLVHRDVKPANLLLVGGQVKLADLGLVLVLEGTSATHSQAHSPLYAAPEFWADAARAAPASDQYSLALVYAELRMGVHPFQAYANTDNPMLTLKGAHLHVPPALDGLFEHEREAVARALEKERSARFASCVQFAEALLHPGTLTPADQRRLSEVEFAQVRTLARDLRHRYDPAAVINGIRAEWLSTTDPTRRQWLCVVAGEVSGPDARRWLEQLCQDGGEDELVRMAARSELAQMTGAGR
jgi:serine/threonine protein kinase